MRGKIVAGGPGEEEFVCPNCNEPVNPDWKACPSCGVEFAGEEGEAAPPPKPAAPPAVAAPAKPRGAPPEPPARPKASAAAAPGAAAESSKDKRGPLSKLTRRIGMVGLIGIPVLVLGLAGLVAATNYDKWFAHQGTETIGPNQLIAMIGAIVVLGAGFFLTLVGLLRARSAGQPAELEALTPVAPATTRVEVPAAPPVRAEIPAYAEEELYEKPEPAPEPTPAWTPPAPAPSWTPPSTVAAAPAPAPAPLREEPEEEEGELDLAPPSPPPAHAPAPAAVAAASPAAPAAPAERDELEDLFGELESEVAKAQSDEVHYECPNCHGIVGEDDTTCPHCGVTFEG